MTNQFQYKQNMDIKYDNLEIIDVPAIEKTVMLMVETSSIMKSYVELRELIIRT